MKKLFKKMLPLSMTSIMLLSSIVPTFATVSDTHTVTSNSNQQTEVIYNQESNFEVTVPKLIDLGSDKLTNYTVGVTGDISSDEVIKVIPDESFLMKDISGTTNLKDDVTATVTQDKTEWIFNEFETKGNGTVSALNLTAGTWEGKFNFNIKLEALNEEPAALEAGLYDVEGNMLCTWEESGINLENSTSPNWTNRTIIAETYSEATKLIIPETTTHIGDYAIFACNNLVEIIIPKSVQTIGRAGFSGCSNATIFVPDTVEVIEENAFSNVKNVIYHGLAEGAPWGALAMNEPYCEHKLTIIEEIESTCTEAGSITYLCEKCDESFTTSIPLKNHNYELTTILKDPTCFNSGSGIYTCSGCDANNTTAIPKLEHNFVNEVCTHCGICQTHDYVNNICTRCNACEHDYIDNVCLRCNELMPGLYDENGVLLDAWEDTGIDITYDYSYSGGPNRPDLMTSSGYRVLTDKYPNATKIVIPGNIESIGQTSLQNCKNITEVFINEGVQKISYYAFSSCYGLTTITIPSTISIIDYAFSSCNNLTTVIYNGVEYTSKQALKDALTNNNVEFNDNVFDSTGLLD